VQKDLAEREETSWSKSAMSTDKTRFIKVDFRSCSEMKQFKIEMETWPSASSCTNIFGNERFDSA